jgi:YVTN family beta-propeller protein
MVGTNVGEEPPTSAGFTTRYTLSSNVVWHYPMYSAQLPNPPINTVLPIVTTKHITRPSLPAGTTIDQLPHRLYQLPLTGNTLVVRRGGTTLSWTGGTTITVGRGSDAYPPFRGMTTTLEGVIGADGVNQPNQKVFVVNSGDGTVSIVDVATSAVTDTIDVKTAGRTELYSGVSYNTATGILYVTERNYGTIKAINVATKQIVGSIDLGVALYDVCVHKALNRLYVATEDAGIKVINLATAFSGGAAGTGVSTIVLPSDGVYGYGKTRGLYLSLAEARNLLIAGGRNNPEEIIANDSSGTPIRTMKNGSLFVINCTSNDIVGKKNFNGNVTGVGLDENGLIYCLENAYYNSGWRTPGRMRAFNLNSISLEVGLQYFNYPSGMQLNNVNVGAAPGHLHIGPYQDTGAGLFVSQGKSMSFSSRPRNARWHHGDKRVLLAWEAPNAPMPSNFSGYDIFSRISPAANDQAAIYTRLRTVPPQTTWIDVTSHAGAPLENNRSYDFRIVPSFLGLGVNAGKFSGYGQPLQTFTNIVPRPLWNFVNINAMPSSAAQLKRDYISAGAYWNTVVALPAAVYTALAGYLSFSGVVISSQDTNEPGQYWAANCAASFALIVTASGGYVVPVSCMITRNLAYTQSTAVLAHELGHALGIGSSSTWNTGVTQPTWCPSKYLLSGTIFKNALIGYQEHVRLRNSLDRRVFTHIPLLSVWPYSLSGAVGLHWEHASTNCQSWLPGVPGELMSYDRNNNVRTNVSVGALLDMGYRLCQTNETFKAHFMETAERPAANAMSMQSAPVWVPNETPQEILAPQENGDVGGCCVSANIIGTLYLDGTEPTNV